MRTKRDGRDGREPMYEDKRKRKREDEEMHLETLRNSCENIDPENVKQFKDLPLSRKTLFGLRDSGYVKLTEIQKQSLCVSLRGLDVLGAAKTGSGKTLAFIIPILELLNHKRWVRTDGIGALVITPTRELAYQIFETLRKVGYQHDFSAGLIIGGKDLKFEKRRMNLCNIVICTPGRLLQHMDQNPLFTCDNLQILVLDEADRCLDMGFARTMNAIIENLPMNRQTLLFSATQTKSVRDLARLSLKDPMYVSVHEHAKHSTPEGLQQSYIVCELHEKIDLLWSFIKSHRKYKIIVFLSSCKQVKYHYEMFRHLKPAVSLLALYGTLHQLRRMSIYEEFCRKSRAVLFATDIAARGLDFPEVNWVVQLDCPEDANTYIHRAGRTARYQRGGQSLLVLLPSEEQGMMEELKAKKIPITKIRVNPSKIHSPLMKMQSFLAQYSEMKETAQRAFVSYMKSVHLMKNKTVFNVHALDTDAYSRSLGLAIPPKIRFLKKLQKLQDEKAISAMADEVNALTLSNNKESENKEESGSDIAINIKDDYITVPNKKETVSFAQDDSESDNENDLLRIKRKNHDLDCSLTTNESGTLTTAENQEDPKKKKKAFVTRYAAAKKILKKKLVANKKIVFDEEGTALVDHMREKASDVAREYEVENVGGIDIEKAKLIMKEEDKYDRKLFREKVKAKHREEKLRAKKSKSKLEDEGDAEEEIEDGNEVEDHEDEEPESTDDSDSEPDLSWLPDPDKVYGPKHNSDGEEEEEDDDTRNIKQHFPDEQDKDASIRFKSGAKRKSDHGHNSKETKRRKARESPDVRENLLADEELALHFLKSR